MIHEDAVQFIRYIPHVCADLAMMVSDYKHSKKSKLPPQVWRDYKDQFVQGKPFYIDSYDGESLVDKNWEYEIYINFDYYYFQYSYSFDNVKEYLLPLSSRLVNSNMIELPLIWKALLNPWPQKPPPPCPKDPIGMMLISPPLYPIKNYIDELKSKYYVEYYTVDMIIDEVYSKINNPEEETEFQRKFKSEEYKESMKLFEQSVSALLKKSAAATKKVKAYTYDIQEKIRKDSNLIKVIISIINELLERKEENYGGFIFEWSLNIEMWYMFTYITSNQTFKDLLGKGCGTVDQFTKKMKTNKFELPKLIDDNGSPWKDTFHNYGVLLIDNDEEIDVEEINKIKIHYITGKQMEGSVNEEFIDYPYKTLLTDYKNIKQSGKDYFSSYPPEFTYKDDNDLSSIVEDVFSIYRKLGWSGEIDDPIFDIETIDGRISKTVYEYQKNTWLNGGEDAGNSIQELMLEYERNEFETVDNYNELLTKLYRLEERKEKCNEDILVEVSNILKPNIGGFYKGTLEEIDDIWLNTYRSVEKAKEKLLTINIEFINEIIENMIKSYNLIIEKELKYWMNWIRLFIRSSMNSKVKYSYSIMVELANDLYDRITFYHSQISSYTLESYLHECLDTLTEDFNQFTQILREDFRREKIEKYQKKMNNIEETEIVEESEKDFSNSEEMIVIDFYGRSLETIVNLGGFIEHKIQELIDYPLLLQMKIKEWIDSRIKSESNRIHKIKELPIEMSYPIYDIRDDWYKYSVMKEIKQLIPSFSNTMKWLKLLNDDYLNYRLVENWFYNGINNNYISEDWLLYYDSSSFIMIGKKFLRKEGNEFLVRNLIMDMINIKYKKPEIKFILKLYKNFIYKDKNKTGFLKYTDYSKVKLIIIENSQDCGLSAKSVK